MKHAIALTFFMIFSLALMADVYSTTSGGSWGNPYTWEGLAVPSPTDNVVIQGPVIVNTDPTCNNLTVGSGGSLINEYYGTYYLTVNGNLTNAGSITNVYNHLILTAKGNLVNTGHLAINTLYLSGTANQNLSNTGTFSPTYLTDTNASSSLTLLTDISLASVNVNLGNSSLVLNGSVVSDLSLSGGYLQNAAIHGGNGASITLGGDCYLNNVSMDEIVLEGTVIIMENISFGILYNYATLYNYIYGGYTLTVTQRLENYGTIRNHPTMNNVYLLLQGDLYNYGTISTQSLTLAKTSLCNLFLAADATPISCPNIYSSDAAGNYQLLSDLRFTNSNINMYNKTIFMNQGGTSYDISISGGYLTNAVLDGGGSSTLTLGNDAFMSSVSCDEIILEGTVIIKEDNSIGILYNYATLYNYVYGVYTLNVTQRLENYGTIRNHPTMNHVYLSLQGDLYNYGTISTQSLTLAKTSLCNLFLAADAPPISCPYINSSSGSGNYQLLSDLRFTNSNIDMFNKTLMMNQGGASYDLSISGGYLTNAVLDGGGSSTLTLGNAAFMSSVSCDEIILEGTVIIKENNSIGILYNYATLYNDYYSPHTLTVTQRLENHGVIQNNNNYVYLLLQGDLYNYGTISTHSLTLAKTSLCNLFQETDAPPISCPYIYSSSGSGNYQLLSDLRFTNSNIDMFNKTLMLNLDGVSYDLSISGGYLTNAVLDGGGSSTLTLGNNAFMSSVSCDEIILEGTVIIKDNVSFGNLYNYATLSNYIHSSHTLTVTQRLENHGLIQNNMNYVDLSLQGDLINYGTIQIHQVLVCGIADQHIVIAPGSVISCSAGFTLVSDVGEAQWYLNGLINNSNYNTNLNVNPTVPGVWQPFNGTIFGRYIIIGNGAAVSQPQNLLISRNGPNLNLQWNEVANALYYDIYAATDPYGTYTFLTKAFDHDTTDGIVWCEFAPAGNKGFYKVTAGN